MLQSQYFLKKLSKLLSLDHEINIKNELINNENCVTALNIRLDKNKWVNITYEYSPHLFEISFSYHQNLFHLKDEISYFLDKFIFLTSSNDFIMSFKGKLNPTQISNIDNATNEFQKNLYHTRLSYLNDSRHSNELNIG